MNQTGQALGSLEVSKAASVYGALRRTRPVTRRDLANYLKVFLGIDVPDKKICGEHDTPMDYLWHAYSTEDRGQKTEDR